VNIRRPSIRRKPSKNISRRIIQDTIDSVAQLATEKLGIPIEEARQRIKSFVDASGLLATESDEIISEEDWQCVEPIVGALLSQEPAEAREKRKNQLSHVELADLETLQALNELIQKGQYAVEISPGHLWDIPLLTDLTANMVRLTLSREGGRYLPAKAVAARLGISRQMVNRLLRFILDTSGEYIKVLRALEKEFRERKLTWVRDADGKAWVLAPQAPHDDIRQMKIAHMYRPEWKLFFWETLRESNRDGGDVVEVFQKRWAEWLKLGAPRCHNPRCEAMLLPGDLDLKGVTMKRNRKYCSPACRNDRRLRGTLGADHARSTKGSLLPAHTSSESTQGAETDAPSEVEQLFQDMIDQWEGAVRLAAVRRAKDGHKKDGENKGLRKMRNPTQT